MTPNKTSGARRSHIALLLPLLIAAAALIVAVEEEPYHIDELRQTRSYSMPFSEVIERSFAQAQPPLDSLLNASLQRVVGIGDWQQRALSVLFALAGLYMLGILLVRGNFGPGAPFGVLAVAISPVLISVFAYARPYALPFFLMVGFLLAVDYWLAEKRIWSSPVMIVVALLLPLSRTIEPNLVLGATAATMLLLRLSGAHRNFSGSVWVPAAASAIGISVVGVPVILRLSGQLAGYTDDGLIPSSEQLRRLITDLPEALAAALPFWPAVVALLVVTLVLPRTRSLLISNWWVWVIAVLPVAFTSLFLLTTNPAQPLFARYLFTWIPLLGVLVAAITGGSPLWKRPGILESLGLVAAFVIFVTTSVVLISDLSSKSRGDWKALSATIVDETDEVTVVVLEDPRGFGDYRTPFAGKPRYLPIGRQAPRALDLITHPELVQTDSAIAIVLAGTDVSVPGWTRVQVDDFFALYLPREPVIGPVEGAWSLQEFARFFDADHGATLVLASASLLHHAGDTLDACAAFSSVFQVHALKPRVMDAVSPSDVDWLRLCNLESSAEHRW